MCTVLQVYNSHICIEDVCLYVPVFPTGYGTEQPDVGQEVSISICLYSLYLFESSDLIGLTDLRQIS